MAYPLTDDEHYNGICKQNFPECNIFDVPISQRFQIVKSEFKITFPSKDLICITRYFCFKPTHTYGCMSIPYSVRLARPRGGSIENEPRIAGKMHTVWKHSRVTRRGTVHGNRQRTTIDS